MKLPSRRSLNIINYSVFALAVGACMANIALHNYSGFILATTFLMAFCSGLTFGSKVVFEREIKRPRTLIPLESPMVYENVFIEATVIREEDCKDAKNHPGADEQYLQSCNLLMKQLFTLSKRYEEVSMRAEMEMKLAPSESDSEKAYMVEATEANFKYQFINNLAWMVVNETYGLWDIPSLGLRKGWKIVRVPSRPAPSISFERIQ